MSWMSWNYVRFYEIQFYTYAESFIPKKYIFQAVVSKYAKRVPADGICYPNFQWRFDIKF